MQRRIYKTKLRPDRRQEYIDAHRNFSSELMRRYRDAGMKLCAVYLLGDELILLTEAEDHEKTLAILKQDPVDREWQAYVGPMKSDGDWQEMEQIFLADYTEPVV
jgi:L-rhamnose mutarotase